MAILQLLQQLLTTKATAVLAAFALIGGGAAIAAPGMGDEPTDDEPPVSTELDADEVSLDGLEEQQLQQMADACAEEPNSALCSGGSADRDENEDIGAVEPTEDDETVEDEGEEEAAGEGEDDTRSETARRVHRALTGSDEMEPGDPEFGRTVSERARSGRPGDLGRLVSRAARGVEVDEDELDLGEREPRTSPEKRGEDDESDDDGPEASGRPAQAGPPAGTPAAGRGKGRGGR